jgi:hypothetical protein
MTSKSTLNNIYITLLLLLIFCSSCYGGAAGGDDIIHECTRTHIQKTIKRPKTRSGRTLLYSLHFAAYKIQK